MMDNFRRFQAGPDPFGRMWEVEYRWLQTAISIRHSDSVDVKFILWTGDEPKTEKVIALMHPDLLALSRKTGHPLTDAWCLKLAALHLNHILGTGEDLEKTLITAPAGALERYCQELTAPAP